MNEPSEPPAPQPDAALDLPSAGEPAQSIGAYLAAQRRLRGIGIDELAVQTRIPLRSLERLESGQFDADVDGFVRGFVRTVAEALGLDPDETVTRALPEPGASTRRSGPQLSLRRVVWVIGSALAVGLAAGLVKTVSISEAMSPEPRQAMVEIRRDPVRALAEAQGVAGFAPVSPIVALEPSTEVREQRPPRVARGAPPAGTAVGSP